MGDQEKTAIDIAQIKQGIDSLKNDILPPIARAAEKASKGVIELNVWKDEVGRRITSIEENPPIHECTSSEQINKNSRDITGHEKEIAGLTKWRSYLATSSVALIICCIGIIANCSSQSSDARVAQATTATKLESNTREIQALKVSQEAVKQEILQEIRSLAPETTDRDGELVKQIRSKMSPRQQRRLKALLRESGITGLETGD